MGSRISVTACLLMLMLVVACQGDTTTPSDVASVVVTPAEADVVIGANVQFVATGLTTAGESIPVSVSWSSTGGVISGDGTLTAGVVPGRFLVVGTASSGAADTSTVIITPPPSAATGLVLLPASVTTSPGGVIDFFAHGRTSAGDSVPLPVTYQATGGSISGTGRYTVGSTAGSYQIIARSATGLADTAEVTITSGTIGRVTLAPEIAASRAGETTRFQAAVWGPVGERLTVPASYAATCGTVTSAGVFTAPPNSSGSCRVIASAAGKADTTEVVLLANTTSMGIPYGPHNLWASSTTIQSSGVAPFTATIGRHVPASSLVSHIRVAREKGLSVVLTMTGGSHEQYKTNGAFDLVKWQAAMNQYNTPEIRAAVAAGVADGTLIGNSVMDEPFQADGMDDDPAKSWGPAGTLTRERVDGLCAYAKTIFPTLAVGVFHNPIDFEPENTYRVCQFLVVQYATRRGDVSRWRDEALRLTSRDGMAVIFAMNLLDGGTQDKDGVYDCAGTGGLGTYQPNCRMTPEQIRSYGRLLGPAGCAMLSWKYDAEFMSRPENQAAFSEIAITLSRLPRVHCTGTR